MLPARYDLFLCHAWDDRRGTAKELHDALEAVGASVWFSEKNVVLGSPLMREIDRGLAKSRAGLVLVTRSFVKRLMAAGVADKDLSALPAICWCRLPTGSRTRNCGRRVRYWLPGAVSTRLRKHGGDRGEDQRTGLDGGF